MEVQPKRAGGNNMQLKLYSYWRSSCAQRVRIALNLKGLEYEYKAVNLLKGEQFSTEFSLLNPLNFVPVLVDGEMVICDSFAILMYLEEKHPENPLLPSDLRKKAINFQAANIVSSSMQPLQNLPVLKYIEEKVSSEEKIVWAQHHIKKGFSALEKLLKGYAGRFACGDEVSLALQVFEHLRLAKWSHTLKVSPKLTLCQASRHYSVQTILGDAIQADVFLAPQIYGSIKRFNVDMAEFPLLSRLHDAYSAVPAFLKASPENQPDASL